MRLGGVWKTVREEEEEEEEEGVNRIQTNYVQNKQVEETRMHVRFGPNQHQMGHNSDFF